MSYQQTNSRGVIYYLRKLNVKLRGDRPQTIYFFTKDVNSTKGEACDLPDEFIVSENPRSGLLTLKKKR